MATLILGGLGAGIAAMVPGAGLAGIALGFNIGAVIGGIMFAPTQEVGKLNDLKVSGSGYGASIPINYGYGRFAGALIWAQSDTNGNTLFEHSSGGGSSGLGPKQKKFYYTATFAMSICEGPITNIIEIWANDVLVYQSAPPAGVANTTYHLNLHLGTELQVPDADMETASGGAGTTPAYRGLAYVTFVDFDLSKFGNQIPTFTFIVSSGNHTTGTILNDLCLRAGLTSGQIDTTLATKAITGFSIPSRTEIRGEIKQICDTYQIDPVEIDGKLSFIKRGTTPTETIKLTDTGAQVGFSMTAKPRVTIVTLQDLEMPQAIDFVFYNFGNGQQTGHQRAVRYTRDWLTDAQTIQTNLVLNDNEARIIAETILYTLWSERKSYKFSLPLSFLRLTASCNPTLKLATGDVVVRVTSITLQWPGIIEIDAVEDITSQILSQTIAGAPITRTAPTLNAIIPSTFYPWSGTELRDEDSFAPGFYCVATGPIGWPGGIVYYSDGGTDYVVAEAITRKAMFGTANTTLGNASNNTSWDVTNTVDVTLQVAGSLAPETQTNILANPAANKILIGSELIGYAGVALVSALRYTLSTLYRGFRSTPFTGHVSSEKWVNIDGSYVRCVVPSNMIGRTLSVKVLSPGQVLSDVTAQTVVISSPSNIYASTTGMTTAITNAAPKFFNARMFQTALASNIPLDSSYFQVPSGTNGVNYPGGSIQKSTGLFFNTSTGGIIFGNHSALWACWFRIGMSVISAQSFNLYLFDADSDIAVYLEPPSNKAGTITTVGTTVTGSGTAFTTDFSPGDSILITSGTQAGHFCKISAVTNNTSMSLVNAFPSNISTAATYKSNKLVLNYVNSLEETVINTNFSVSLSSAGNWTLHVLTNNGGSQGGINIHTDILSNPITILDLGQ